MDECRELEFRYTSFNPFLYSLDLVIPLIGGKQSKEWTPVTVLPCVRKSWFGLCEEVARVPNRGASIEPMPAYSLSGSLLALLAWFANVFGWFAGLMFVAVASGLIKKD